VIGIRNVGTTLSAVVAASLSASGTPAHRTTVRPDGHPFDRKLRLRTWQQQWLQNAVKERARFFVVDEGPGLSGSSFLSVGEALVAHGISADRITLIGTREADPPRLYAHD